MRRTILAVVLVTTLLPAAALGQPGPPQPRSGGAGETVEVDPIRCWWRTSAGAVRVGETFSVVLTCAVLQNEAVQVVPDETRLDATVIQMAPFEVVDGEHPADLYGPNRRFFQYEYRLRIINPDVIGRDVRIPDPQIHYRVNSTVAANMALQGRDHTYLMPAQSVRVLSLVPADAPDIRDSASEGFGAAEELTFRASVLRIAALTAMTLGAIVAVFGVGRVVVRTRTQKPVAAHGLAPAAILRLARRALTDVQREAASGAWNADLIARALAAARLTAAIAIGRTVQSRGTARRAPTAVGELRADAWRGGSTTISAAATAEDVSGALDKLNPTADSARRQTLEHLRDALVALTRTQYGRDAMFESGALDEAVARALAAARALGSAHAWPKAYLRRWMPQVPAEQRV